jgi:hypothetical protein
MAGGLASLDQEPHCRARTLPKPENGHQRFVNAPLLLRADPADKVSQAACVDCADLLDEDACDLTEQVNLRAERRGPRAARCRSYEYDRARQQLVCLNDHAVTAAFLVMTSPRGGRNS